MPDNPQRDRFLALGGAKLPPRERPERERTLSKGGTSNSSRKSLARTGGPKRTGRPKRVSDKQAVRNAKWAGIREATIYWLNKLDPDGARCFECGRKSRRLELDHIDPRARGGANSVSNAQLLCAGPGSCHERKHGRPEFSSHPSDSVESDA